MSNDQIPMNPDAAVDTLNRHMQTLRTRGAMYLGTLDLQNLVTYLLGYDDAARQLGLNPPLEGMHELVQLRFGRPSALTWPALLKHEFVKPGEDPINLLFQFYDELVQIRRERGLDFLKSEMARIETFKRKRKTNPNWPD